MGSVYLGNESVTIAFDSNDFGSVGSQPRRAIETHTFSSIVNFRDVYVYYGLRAMEFVNSMSSVIAFSESQLLRRSYIQVEYLQSPTQLAPDQVVALLLDLCFSSFLARRPPSVRFVPFTVVCCTDSLSEKQSMANALQLSGVFSLTKFLSDTDALLCGFADSFRVMVSSWQGEGRVVLFVHLKNDSLVFTLGRFTDVAMPSDSPSPQNSISFLGSEENLELGERALIDVITARCLKRVKSMFHPQDKAAEIECRLRFAVRLELQRSSNTSTSLDIRFQYTYNGSEYETEEHFDYRSIMDSIGVPYQLERTLSTLQSKLPSVSVDHCAVVGSTLFKDYHLDLLRKALASPRLPVHNLSLGVIARGGLAYSRLRSTGCVMNFLSVPGIPSNLSQAQGAQRSQMLQAIRENERNGMHPDAVLKNIRSRLSEIEKTLMSKESIPLNFISDYDMLSTRLTQYATWSEDKSAAILREFYSMTLRLSDKISS